MLSSVQEQEQQMIKMIKVFYKLQVSASTSN